MPRLAITYEHDTLAAAGVRDNSTGCGCDWFEGGRVWTEVTTNVLRDLGHVDAG